MRLLALLLLCFPAGAVTLYRVACGAAQAAVDPAGNVWQSDTPYVTGGARFVSSVLAGLPVPYRTLRSSVAGAPFLESFPVTAGVTYSVTLKFAEPRTLLTTPPAGAGLRVFSVMIDGTVRLANVDLFAASGALTPKDYTFPVTASSGTLVIAFPPAIGNAVASGIQLDGPDPVVSLTPVYLKGLETERPVACPGDLGFYVAKDTRRLFWCSGTDLGWSFLASSVPNATNTGICWYDISPCLPGDLPVGKP